MGEEDVLGRLTYICWLGNSAQTEFNENELSLWFLHIWMHIKMTRPSIVVSVFVLRLLVSRQEGLV